VTWVLLGAGTIIAVEVFIKLPIAKLLGDFLQLISKISRTISSSYISDHWKEKVLINYAGQLLSISLLLLVYCVIPFVPFALLAGISQAYDVGVFQLAASPGGVIASVVIATGYFLTRSRIVQ